MVSAQNKNMPKKAKEIVKPTTQTLRIPVLQTSKNLQQQMRNLQKTTTNGNSVSMVNKLNQFNPIIRQTPNQTVRNIPNPSAALLARHVQQQVTVSSATTATSSTTAVTNTTKNVAEITAIQPSSVASSTMVCDKPMVNITAVSKEVSKTITTPILTSPSTTLTPIILKKVSEKV